MTRLIPYTTAEPKMQVFIHRFSLSRRPNSFRGAVPTLNPLTLLFSALKNVSLDV